MPSGFSITGGSRDFTFRHGPEEINWQYTLRTSSKETYGGRVVQILGCSIDDLNFTTMSGRGGERYRREVVLFFRDTMLWQRATGKTVKLALASRGYAFNVYLKSVQFTNALTDVGRLISCSFVIQEDINGILSDKVISDELKRLQEGIGYTRNEYNTPIVDYETYGIVNDSPPSSEK